ncbi:hypothetical protein RSAG8_08525, partial [Rhizoctonia solani AG-8 WAC10335]
MIMRIYLCPAVCRKPIDRDDSCHCMIIPYHIHAEPPVIRQALSNQSVLYLFGVPCLANHGAPAHLYTSQRLSLSNSLARTLYGLRVKVRYI